MGHKYRGIEAELILRSLTQFGQADGTSAAVHVLTGPDNGFLLVSSCLQKVMYE